MSLHDLTEDEIADIYTLDCPNKDIAFVYKLPLYVVERIKSKNQGSWKVIKAVTGLNKNSIKP